MKIRIEYSNAKCAGQMFLTGNSKADLMGQMAEIQRDGTRIHSVEEEPEQKQKRGWWGGLARESQNRR